MFVEHLERVILLCLFVFDEQHASERPGTQCPLALEVL